MNKALLAAAWAASLAIAAPASATIVTFDGHTSSGNGVFGDGTTYMEGGLTFTSSVVDVDALYHWGTSGGNDADPDGATMLQNDVGASITITPTAGGSIFLTSIDLADGFNTGAAGPVGYSWIDGGGAHSGSVTLDNLEGLQTFALNLAGVTSFTIGPQVDPYWQMDNITYSASAATPEPAEWALMLVGFGALGAMTRRRRVVAA
jgi:hypothetical protein